MFYVKKIKLIGRVSVSGSADSEVSDEQKKEKVVELKRKEKDLQEKLTKKLQELKEICLREAVSVSVCQFHTDGMCPRVSSHL